MMTTQPQDTQVAGPRPALPNGPAAAAFVAAGSGCFAIGLLTWLAAWNDDISRALTLYEPVGPLSGKAAGAVLLWLVAWAGLHGLWRSREFKLDTVLNITIFLVGLGFLGTFPPFVNLTIGWLPR